MPVFMGGRRSFVFALMVVSLLVAMIAPALATEEDQGETGTPVSEEPPPPTEEPPPPAEEPPPPAEEPPPPAEEPPPPAEEPPPPAEEPPPPAPKGPKPTFVPVKRYNVLKKLVFPVAGSAKFHASFGACRDNCTREHHGIDITTRGWKGVPVVAAHDGTVIKVTYDEGNPGCSVRIKGRDRWETRYYHLNNDLPGTDEIGAPCPAAGIEVGAKVVAGQIIGYVGDSGNAEHTLAHLHFELRNRSGYPIDPYRSLRKAERVTFEWLPDDAQTATIALSEASYPKGAKTLILVPTEEMPAMTGKDEGIMVLQAPVIAVDRNNPAAAVKEIERLRPDRIMVMSDTDTNWLEDLARSIAFMVDTAPLPVAKMEPNLLKPDVVEEAAFEMNPKDRFATLISGVVDKIYRSKQPAYGEFIADHRTVVFTGDTWAPRGIGQRTNVSPGRRADRKLLWWLTAQGWIGTEEPDEAPSPGVAYVTERRVNIGILNFLGSLAELPPAPLWRSR
jgi:murein DD-endopeptidase MepM/ murein hydrolase activator NlpD